MPNGGGRGDPEGRRGSRLDYPIDASHGAIIDGRRFGAVWSSDLIGDYAFNNVALAILMTNAGLPIGPSSCHPSMLQEPPSLEMTPQKLAASFASLGPPWIGRLLGILHHVR
jgi:hypothetical protein